MAASHLLCDHTFFFFGTFVRSFVPFVFLDYNTFIVSNFLSFSFKDLSFVVCAHPRNGIECARFLIVQKKSSQCCCCCLTCKVFKFCQNFNGYWLHGNESARAYLRLGKHTIHLRLCTENFFFHKRIPSWWAHWSVYSYVSFDLFNLNTIENIT